MQYYTTEKQHIDLCDLEIPGRILDIGGGGEGIIARRFGDKVIAIDALKEELEESPDVGLKIIMDARELKFLDNSIDNITCFYSLMYMKEEMVDTVLAEAYRVLKPGGGLWIWDAVMPWPAKAEVFCAPLEVYLPEETVTVTYGIGWSRGQQLNDIQHKCENAGFDCVVSHGMGAGFHLQVKK